MTDLNNKHRVGPEELQDLEMAAGPQWLCANLLFVMFVSADEKIIPAESGQDVTLTCRATNKNIYTLEWSRADLGGKNVLFYWKHHFDPANQHPSFKNRVDLKDRQMKDGDVSLILKDVTIDDTGRYECRVVMEQTRSWGFISIINLRVVVPPDKIIPAEPGQDVTLTSQAPNNNITAVKWSRADLGDKNVLLYRDGKFETDNQHPSFKNRVDLQDRQMKAGDVSLILKNVTTADTGTYECRVAQKSEERMKLRSRRSLIVAEPKTLPAESGQNVTLTSRAPNKNIYTLEWSRADLGGKNVLFYQKHHFDPANQHPSFKNRVDLKDRQMKDGDVSLILKDVTINDTGRYECHVFMTETRSWEVTSFINLRVVDPPGQKNITALSGQDVTLTCRAQKKITVLKWSRADLGSEYVLQYHDNQSVPDDQHPSFKNRVDLQDREMKDGDVSLILKDVTTNDTGTYECGVFMEETRSWEVISIIYLTVVDPPDQKNITAESGQDVTLTCRAPNNNFIVVEWSRADLGDEYVFVYKDEGFHSNSQHPSFKNRVDLQDRQMKDGDVSLILKDVMINDTGTYKCRVVQIGTEHLKLINTTYLHVDPPGE
uniref:Ig-like domain-containing protein n=1 Tax=Oreochromis niloticus TaxID=8128 RepID=A0A669CHI2_ORENI